MSTQPETIFRQDYTPPPFWIETVDLTFELLPQSTQVTSRLRIRRNHQVKEQPLILAGVDLQLISITMQGRVLLPDDYQLDKTTLTLALAMDVVDLCIVTQIDPASNTSLDGLYISSGMYCTQCEAEGFRKITYYLDRPDVMALFTTKIIADKQQYPVLLSNGNWVAAGELDGHRHWVQWQDPFKKPCYLFALVAGNLDCVTDTFVTQSGREVSLRIFVEPQDVNKVDHAMLSLKQAMRWDEQMYGREYDLDIFMIVAVSHFNMGAMENKGLNIFNTSCVLAHPQTTTDGGFQRVEAVVAHEYFHNWTGNRVTCRDWFQLSLKEGFTVFRDQCFSADMGSEAVQRVQDVNLLRSLQFAEDAGPMSHAIRPDSYIEINNFYTLTIYEKGAEVVRMLHTLLGADGFRRGSDLYFDRHDGQAVTCDDFVQVMADANQVDLTHFKRWYQQSGTPEVSVQQCYDAATQTLTLTFIQHTPVTARQPATSPLSIPIRLGLLDSQTGQPLSFALQSDEAPQSASAQGASAKISSADNLSVEKVLLFTQSEQTFRLTQVARTPIASLFRGFSAPVKFNPGYQAQQWAFLMAHDVDPFNRWEAATQLYVQEIQQQCVQWRQGQPVQLSAVVLNAFHQVLNQKLDDQAGQAQLLTLPGYAYLAGLQTPIDVDALCTVREQLQQQLATAGLPLLKAYLQAATDAPYAANAAQIGQRALRNLCLLYFSKTQTEQAYEFCRSQFYAANNMTDQYAALTALTHSPSPLKHEVLQAFYQQWQHEPLVMDQWFSVQATSPQGDTLAQVQKLLQHPLFDRKNPNRLRALISAFSRSNPLQFHRLDGAGYALLADEVIALNTINPSIAARLLPPLSEWAQHLPARQTLMRSQLERIAQQPALSTDVYEVVSRVLN
jgi:aminopeptidase N